MLTNKIIFKRLMALLRSICPSLPGELEPFLWENMREEDLCRVGRYLEWQGEEPHKAYFVVCGYVLIYSFDAEQNKHTFRIYIEDTIIALDSFLEQTESEYMIWACPGAVVWSIDRKHMPGLKAIEGMELVIEKTASKFKSTKERMRADFLILSDEMRVLKLYTDFPDLFPPRLSPILDEDLSDYLDLDMVRFRRIRRKLRRGGFLGENK